MLRAKRTIEALLETREALVLVPRVEGVLALIKALRLAGISARRLGHGAVDVRQLRERLALTQEQFALRYGIDLDALQNWEQGRRAPDATAQSYLRVIERNPVEAARAQEEDSMATAED
jgi:putative transcriptional regulator